MTEVHVLHRCLLEVGGGEDDPHRTRSGVDSQLWGRTVVRAETASVLHIARDAKKRTVLILVGNKRGIVVGDIGKLSVQLVVIFRSRATHS
jgi:hypothetical protein